MARTNPEAITICAQRRDEYRIKSEHFATRKTVRPRTHPNGAAAPPSRDTNVCERSGGCRALEALDWKNVALVAAKMAAKAAAGESVGDVFVTQPEPSEYELYKMAKRDREEREAEAEAAKVRREAQARKKAQAESERADQP